MQDKTIDNALIELRKRIIQGDGSGRDHVEALLLLRGVAMPRVIEREAPVARRGTMQRMVLEALMDGPKSRKQIVAHIALLRPDVPPERLYWRVDAALAKVHARMLVRREGRVWRLAP